MLSNETVQPDRDRINGMREKAEPILQGGNRAVITDDVECERSTSVHCGLSKARSVTRSRCQLKPGTLPPEELRLPWLRLLNT